MNVSEAIFSRRSTRAFSDRPVDDPTVRKLLEAAVHAPSAMNGQPWVFSVLQDRGQLARYSDRAKVVLLERMAQDPKPSRYLEMLQNPAFNIFYDAGTLIVIGVRERGAYAEADCWLAAANLMLAGTEAGLGSCCIGFAMGVLNTAEVKAEIGLPPSGAVLAALVVGYPSVAPQPVPRKPPTIACWTR
jgi:nitroreductase